MEINEIPHVDGVVLNEDDMVCIRLSSEDDAACQKVSQVIIELFDKARWIYKAIGFAEDIDSQIKFCNVETVRRFEGKTKFKIVTVSYPELHGEISDQDKLLHILRSWSSAIYQTQVIYITEEGETILSVLRDDLYKDTDSISSVWQNVKLAVRNHPEAVENNTFLLYVHKQYLASVEKLLK